MISGYLAGVPLQMAQAQLRRFDSERAINRFGLFILNSYGSAFPSFKRLALA